MLAILWQERSVDFASIRGSIFGIMEYAENQLRHTGTTVIFNLPLIYNLKILFSGITNTLKNYLGVQIVDW